MNKVIDRLSYKCTVEKVLSSPAPPPLPLFSFEAIAATPFPLPHDRYILFDFRIPLMFSVAERRHLLLLLLLLTLPWLPARGVGAAGSERLSGAVHRLVVNGKAWLTWLDMIGVSETAVLVDLGLLVDETAEGMVQGSVGRSRTTLNGRRVAELASVHLAGEV